MSEANSRRVRGRGPALTKNPSPGFSLTLETTLSREGRGKRRRAEGLKSYTAAVVTPPSTTIVCPVMKLEASEPR
jgi:hypothetical protein